MYKNLLLILPFLLFAKSNNEEVRSTSNVRQLLKCASTLDYSCVLDYVQNAADNAYNSLIKEADAEARKMSIITGRADEEPPSSILSTITNIISELPNLLRASLNAALSGEEVGNDEKTSIEEVDDATEDDEEEEGEGEESEDDSEQNSTTVQPKALGDGVSHCKNGTICRSRSSKGVERYSNKNSVSAKHLGVSRKKKKKKKLKAIIKFIAIAAILIIKLNIILKLLAAKLQIKFFLIAAVNLIINLARFWWDLKKGHNEQPQKVIYYEHAQHQHHYDGGDDWHSSGPSDSYWGRSYEKEDDDNKKTAQDLAYSKQAPGGTTYSRIDNKPNFSWNPWAERSL
ncbi:hypothetical protein RI129_002113 [Pyrocoelia pectoralis]|uniref:Uncharacterized protein n=1 Tax=Pyrocoelia pectoralis TaxID=417401 RepID=A0AAN7VLB0_9COLE